MLSLTWLSQLVGVRLDALMTMAVGVSLGCQQMQAWRSRYEIALRTVPAVRLVRTCCMRRRIRLMLYVRPSGPVGLGNLLNPPGPSTRLAPIRLPASCPELT
jgi:hypothetical protein